MAATLPSQPDLRHWEQSDQYHSHPQAEPRESRISSRRAPNRVKSKPANPAVITGILESLDTLTSPPIFEQDGAYSETSSKFSRPQSPDSAITSTPSLALTRSISPGFGVEYGTGLSLDDEDGLSDAALPPTVRTSRPASGLSYYHTPRSPSFTRLNGSRSRQSSIASASRENLSPARNKLSAESWVRQNQMSKESVSAETPSKRGRRRSLRRKSSYDTLKPARTRIELVPPAAEPPPNISRAEQIIAKATTPPVSSSKRRLYLTDSGSNESQAVGGSPAPIQEFQETEEDPPTPASSSTKEGKSPLRISPQKNAIVDSIPTRVSSLRSSSSPVPGKRRERKSKRQASTQRKTDAQMDDSPTEEPRVDDSITEESKIDSKVYESPEDHGMEKASSGIPESSWADLGEDDETVRRIRELREQRKSRMLESRVSSVQEDIPTLQRETSDTTVSSDDQQPFRPSEDAQRNPRSRPTASRSSTDPPTKALKVLGITADESPQSIHTVQMNGDNRGGSVSPVAPRYVNTATDEFRPSTKSTAVKVSSSPTPPLSLDYSYAQAVDALQQTNREVAKKEAKKDKPPPQQKPAPSVRTSNPLQYADLPLAGVPMTNNFPVRTPSKIQKRKTSTQERFAPHHPDLPLDFTQRRDRRKSMSDARNTRQLDEDEDHPVPRRDSIGMAVDEYLQSARLSRKIKHPHSGRIISFSEVGDSNGAAVFICVGMGLTRYVTAFYDELATTLRLRLITVDRPGVGGSEPYPPNDRSGPLSWPDDILAISQYLGIHKFSMLAHSAGAIYALATALILPHLVQGKVHLLAPWIPPSQLAAFSYSTASAPPAGALPRSQRFLRVLPTPFLKAANSSFMTATSTSLKPTTKRKPSNGKIEQRRPETSVATGRPSSVGRERPLTTEARPTQEFSNRRESMMLMDQFMPEMNPMESFPMAAKAEEQDSEPRSESLIMSATATPMDPSFEYAATALNAAEHAEKERKQAFTSRLTQRTWELATRDSNPATDLLVCLERHRDVGFRYTDVNREVVITHGSEDKRVPVANIKWLAEQMNRKAATGNDAFGDNNVYARGGGKRGCEVRILEGEGHGLMASPVLMSDLLTEIAGYWKGPGRTIR